MIFLKTRATIWPTHEWHFFSTNLAAHFTEEAKAKPRRSPYGNIWTSMNAHGTSITLLARRNWSKLLDRGITEIVDPYPKVYPASLLTCSWLQLLNRLLSISMQLTYTAEPPPEYPACSWLTRTASLSIQHIVDLHSWTAFRILLDRHNRNRTSLSRTICKFPPAFSWAHDTADPPSWHHAEIDIPYWNSAPQLTSLSPIIRPPEK